METVGQRGNGTPKPPLKLGTKIRARRKDRDLTLVDVAKRTDLSIGFLSQVERDITAPSLSSLALIAAALGARISDFIEEPPAVALHLKRERQRTFAIDPTVISYERLSTSFPGKTLNAIRMDVPPGYRSEITRHEGEEFVFVLAGAIRYALAEKHFDLAAGDSLHFSASQPHRVENHGKRPAQVLTVVTQDLFGERKRKSSPAKRGRGTAEGGGGGDPRHRASSRPLHHASHGPPPPSHSDGGGSSRNGSRESHEQRELSK